MASISLEEFKRIELRIGEITAADPVPGSRNLLRLTVNLGEEQRTIVSALAKSYRPADLCGLQVVMVANLAPATFMGVESQGMLLGVEDSGQTNISLLTVNRQASIGAHVT
jgi:methionine--tRNA ligase beta chain